MTTQFETIKTTGLIVANADGSLPTQTALFHIDNYNGNARYSQNPSCLKLTVGPITAPTATIYSIFSMQTDISNTTVMSDINVRSIPSITCSALLNSNKYLCYNNKSLLWTPSQNTYSNVVGWISALQPTLTQGTIGPTDLAGAITAINNLITLFASRGIITTSPPLNLVFTSVDSSGFTVSWSPSSPPYTLLMDNTVYASGIMATQYSIITGPVSNIFPYLVTLVDSSGARVILPVSICNINNNPTDQMNYFGLVTQGPASSRYYRVTSPGTNYIILISQKYPYIGLSTFNIAGSNASPTNPIRFKSWNGFVYDTADIKITDRTSRTLTYDLFNWF